LSDELKDFEGLQALVIDDDDDFRAIVSSSLSRAGLQVTEVEDAGRGLEHAAQHPPHVILMDVWMPGWSGIQACARFRQQRATANVPILLMSAQWRDEAQLCRAIDAGATDVLAKERQSFELIARVRSALTLQSLRAQLHDSERKLDELRSFIAICAGCRMVRNDQGEWEDIEVYLQRVTDRELTHGICDACKDRIYGTTLRGGR
jgi:sigma-B regulation protein RsbU (phosphoserine phosphatase)